MKHHSKKKDLYRNIKKYSELNYKKLDIFYKRLELVSSNLKDALKYYKENDLQNYAKDALKDLE